MMRLSRVGFLFLAGLTLTAQCFTAPLPGLAQATAKWNNVPNAFPSKIENADIGACHGGAGVDRNGNVYISSDTARGILVFGPDGKFIKGIGPNLVHGLQVRREGQDDFLYCARPSAHECVKLKTDGTVVWTLKTPMESKVYDKPEEFNPTNIVSLRDGTIFVADGYGKNWIHKFDKDLKWIKAFGGPTSANPAEDGKFNRCHGLGVDGGETPTLIVCNRESGKVERWSTDGELIKVLQRGLRMPAAVHANRNFIAVAELQGRVTVLDKAGNIVQQLGDNPKPEQRANFGLEPGMWTDGIINSAHGVTFDREGNIIVAEWSKFGRVHKFELQK